MERQNFKGPDLSIVLPAGQARRETLDRLATLDRTHGTTVQIIVFASVAENGQSLRPAASSGVGSLPPIQYVAAKPDEPMVACLSRTISAAIGTVILLGQARQRDLIEMPTLFRNESDLGVFRTGPVRRREPPTARGLLNSGLAVRGDLWSALRGFDEAFQSPSWALRDFCLRARAIGFSAPKRIIPFDDDIALESDRRLYRSRARIAPDRSGEQNRPRENSIEPAQMAVFTAITGCYDTLKPQPSSAAGGASLVAFLDAPTAALHNGQTRGWQLAPASFPEIDDRRASRYFKVNAHLALPDSSYSLWIDASVSLVAPYPVNRLAERFLGECDICVFRHSVRRSIYEEADVCKERGLDRAETIDSQIDRYRREGLPYDTGLAELPIILRRHSDAIRAFNEAWWSEILAGSWRDQLSFNYVVWKSGLRYATFPLSMAIQNGLFLKYRRIAPPGAERPAGRISGERQ
jgi:hypothetical protein